MPRPLLFITLVFAVEAFGGRAFAAPAGALMLQDAFAEIAASAKPAVVNISIMQEQPVREEGPQFFFGDSEDFFRQFLDKNPRRSYKYYAQGTGTGFIIDPKGYLLTSEHVVREATDIRITVTPASGKEKTYFGKVVGRAATLDLALVKIESKEDFPYLDFADALPRAGDWAIAIGSPFALEQTLTVGVVSAVRQSLSIENRRYANMIQTDAAINRGNSGGPLLNIHGKVLGVNTAIYSPTGVSAGVGFAIPAGEVTRELASLLAANKVRSAWLGADALPVDEVLRRRFALPSAEGALISALTPAGPGEKSGLRRGDVIRRFGSRKISTPQDLSDAIARAEPGAKVAAQVYRDGSPREIQLVLGRRLDRGGTGQDAGKAQALPEPEEDQFEWQGALFIEQAEGVVVARLAAGSTFEGYLLPGDLLQAVQRDATPDLKALRAALKRFKSPQGLVLDVVRQGQPLYISVK